MNDNHTIPNSTTLPPPQDTTLDIDGTATKKQKTTQDGYGLLPNQFNTTTTPSNMVTDVSHLPTSTPTSMTDISDTPTTHAATTDQTNPGQQVVVLPAPIKNPCVICDKPSKYTCPGCALKTCSVPCVNQHKAKFSCNGKAKDSVYVEKRNFGVETIKSDLKLLTKVEVGLRDGNNLLNNMTANTSGDVGEEEGERVEQIGSRYNKNAAPTLLRPTPATTTTSNLTTITQPNSNTKPSQQGGKYGNKGKFGQHGQQQPHHHGQGTTTTSTTTTPKDATETRIEQYVRFCQKKLRIMLFSSLAGHSTYRNNHSMVHSLGLWKPVEKTVKGAFGKKPATTTPTPQIPTIPTQFRQCVMFTTALLVPNDNVGDGNDDHHHDNTRTTTTLETSTSNPTTTTMTEDIGGGVGNDKMGIVEAIKQLGKNSTEFRLPTTIPSFLPLYLALHSLFSPLTFKFKSLKDQADEYQKALEVMTGTNNNTNESTTTTTTMTDGEGDITSPATKDDVDLKKDIAGVVCGVCAKCTTPNLIQPQQQNNNNNKNDKKGFGKGKFDKNGDKNKAGKGGEGQDATTTTTTSSSSPQPQDTTTSTDPSNPPITDGSSTTTTTTTTKTSSAPPAAAPSTPKTFPTILSLPTTHIPLKITQNPVLINTNLSIYNDFKKFGMGGNDEGNSNGSSDTNMDDTTTTTTTTTTHPQHSYCTCRFQQQQSLVMDHDVNISNPTTNTSQDQNNGQIDQIDQNGQSTITTTPIPTQFYSKFHQSQPLFLLIKLTSPANDPKYMDCPLELSISTCLSSISNHFPSLSTLTQKKSTPTPLPTPILDQTPTHDDKIAHPTLIDYPRFLVVNANQRQLLIDNQSIVLTAGLKKTQTEADLNPTTTTTLRQGDRYGGHMQGANEALGGTRQGQFNFPTPIHNGPGLLGAGGMGIRLSDINDAIMRDEKHQDKQKAGGMEQGQGRGGGSNITPQKRSFTTMMSGNETNTTNEQQNDQSHNHHNGGNYNNGHQHQHHRNDNAIIQNPFFVSHNEQDTEDILFENDLRLQSLRHGTFDPKRPTASLVPSGEIQNVSSASINTIIKGMNNDTVVSDSDSGSDDDSSSGSDDDGSDCDEMGDGDDGDGMWDKSFMKLVNKYRN